MPNRAPAPVIKILKQIFHLNSSSIISSPDNNSNRCHSSKIWNEHPVRSIKISHAKNNAFESSADFHHAPDLLLGHSIRIIIRSFVPPITLPIIASPSSVENR
mmetsp:Transcript_17038/g.30907  ORF Transcript_17038/g.30907 Transcript_17038/m.30907 type:complete len:103 (+) Transcript_17038:42-350(+)